MERAGVSCGMDVRGRLTWLLLLLVGAWPAAAQPEGRPLALVTTYADGRVTESLVPSTGFRAWTPMFPRVPGWKDPEGVLPITALNLAARADGEVLRVTVSVLRGKVRDVIETVAETVVGVGTPVQVDALRSVGVMPVTLSATWFAVPALHVPRARSNVGDLEVETVEPVIEPKPGYLVTVRNRSDAALVTLAYSTYVNTRAAVSGQHGDPSVLPVAEPGGTVTFRIPIGSSLETGRGFATGTPLDDVLIAAAIWADGRLGGDTGRVAPLLAVHRGRLSALSRVIPILRAAGTTGDPLATLDQVRSAIAALPIASEAMAVATVMRLVPGMSPFTAQDVQPAVSVGSQNVRTRLLEDIDRVRPHVTATQARQWIAEALPACDAWMRRLQALFQVR